MKRKRYLNTGRIKRIIQFTLLIPLLLLFSCNSDYQNDKEPLADAEPINLTLEEVYLDDNVSIVIMHPNEEVNINEVISGLGREHWDNAIAHISSENENLSFPCFKLECKDEATDYIANKPFVFAVRENRTGAILFIGKVEKI